MWLLCGPDAEDPQISFAAIGDAPCDDQYPIQVGSFAAGAAMDGWISKLFLEEGGGGTGEESYELTALYYARFCEFTDPETRGVFFISGDESFYTTLRRSDVTRHIGPGVIDADMPGSQIFHDSSASSTSLCYTRASPSRSGARRSTPSWRSASNARAPSPAMSRHRSCGTLSTTSTSQ